VVSAAWLHASWLHASWPGRGPGIGRRAGQQLARRELSRSIYQPSPTAQLLSWLGRRLARLLTAVNGTVPGGWWALVALIVLAVAVISMVLRQVRPARSGRGPGGALRAGRALSAGEHRVLAEQLAAAADFTGAIIERVRAIAAELEEQGVLPPAPGRTAAELAAEAGPALPGQADHLAAAARLFDDVRYGGHSGTAATYREVSELDASLRTVRPIGQAELVPAGPAARPPW
jgi:Domain of unknown function (DUF4129)